ncbi:MAG TPA: hypothetical protein VGI81_28895 [Tepidisphaeraceae bacterium]|jgi:hypothetical protein
MNPEEYLHLGEELVGRKTPCGCRAGLGRAYYGVLQATAKWMEDAGLTPPSRQEIHQKLWQDLLNCGIPELRIAGSELAQLHGYRIKADYVMGDRDTEDFRTADYWVSLAREHLEEIKRMFTGPDRDRAVDAIKAYRRLVNRRV